MPIRYTTWVLLSSTLVSVPAFAADVDWMGSIDSDASNGANWQIGATPGTVPGSGDRARLRFGGNAVVDIGGGATWGQVWFNSAEGGTTIDGTGTLNLAAGVGVLAVQSVGGPDRTSTINPGVTTAGTIQGNGAHNLIFNGDVSAGKFESFSDTTVTFNGLATHAGTDGFITLNATGRIDFAGEFTTTFLGEFGLNGDGGAVYFASYTPPTANQIINLHSGKTIGNLADNAFGEAADIFARSNSTYDLNGFNESLEFLGTNGGNTLGIDFGGLGDANTLNWAASHHMNGAYNVVNFEIGSDALQLGAAGDQFFTDAQLATITINGIGYSASPLATPYWDRDANDFVQFHNVPEPAVASVLGGLGLCMLGARRRSAA